jgi:hypothetical protein
MSLDSRLRAELHEIAASVEPATEVALRTVLARRSRPSRVRRLTPRIVAVAAAVLLVGALVLWQVGGGRGSEPDVVKDPPPPVGTYETTLSGDLAGDWRLRFDRDTMSVLAPDAGPLGTRDTSASYDVHGGVLTTDLLDETCSGRGSYTWRQDGSGLAFSVQDDDCSLRVQLLTASPWSPVSGTPLADGTYETPPLTVAQLRATAVGAGLPEADVDDELSTYGDARAITYTLQLRGGTWTEFETIDAAAPSVEWSGPFDVLDAGTVVAGEPPCGPITYDYRLVGDQLSFVVLDDACLEGGDTAPIGELVAQTTIYQTAPFHRLGE